MELEVDIPCRRAHKLSVRTSSHDFFTRDILLATLIRFSWQSGRIVRTCFILIHEGSVVKRNWEKFLSVSFRFHKSVSFRCCSINSYAFWWLDKGPVGVQVSQRRKFDKIATITDTFCNIYISWLSL